MKQINYILICVLIIISTQSNAQTYASPAFSFCKQMGESLALKELKKCPKLTAKNRKVEIKSFLVAIPVKMDQDLVEDISQLGSEVLYVEYKIIGDELSPETIAFFERPRKGSLKVSIEDVVVVENGKESKYNGFTFYVK